MLLPHRLPRPLRIALYTAISAVLLYLCLAPSDALPETNVGDKWQHVLGWFALTAAGLTLAPRRPRAIAAFALGLGAFVEVLQGAMRAGRHADVRDLAADAVGVALALAAYWMMSRARPRAEPA